MTLRHLEIFRAVCAQESITSAAAALGMTQPAVSIAIRELESFYQTQLFERMNRRIYLTETGRSLLQYADSIAIQFSESIEVLRGQHISRLLRMGVNASVGETHLVRLLHKLHPVIAPPELQITVDNSMTIEQRLMKNEIDLAIIDEISQPAQWTSTVLFSDSMVVAAAPGMLPDCGKITIRELSKMNLLLREAGSGSRKCIEAVFKRHGIPTIPAAESASTMTLLNLAEAGYGAAILPRAMFDGPCARRHLCLAELSDDRFDRHFYLLHHPRKYISTTMSAVINCLKS